jgi:hypothetical protein
MVQERAKGRKIMRGPPRMAPSIFLDRRGTNKPALCSSWEVFDDLEESQVYFLAESEDGRGRAKVRFPTLKDSPH